MEEHASKYKILGKIMPRVDARPKVTGNAKYAADYEMPGMLWGKVLRAPYPHARILNIDTSEAERLPGVKGVITGKDFGGFKWGWQANTRDEEPLAISKVRYLYEGVAAVAATDKDIAEEACNLIKVDYEELPGVFDPWDAMKEGAPLVHDNKPKNIAVEYHWNFGDVDKAFKESYLVREDKFRTPRQAKGYIEPPACIAYWDDDTLTYIGAKGSPYMVWRIFGRCFNLPLSKVRIIQPTIGCDFGGTKNDAHALDFSAIMLAKKTGKPVKIVYSQFDELTTALRRHSMWITIKTGVAKDGTIKAIYTHVVADGGAYTRMSPMSMYLVNAHVPMPYHLPNFKTDTYNVFTNNPIAAAMRGHGAYHSNFAQELQMDMIAKDLGMDPLELRLKNVIENPKPGEIYYTVNRQILATCGMRECLEGAANLFEWDKYKKQEKVDGSIARGVGIATGQFQGGSRLTGHNACSAVVRINEDGSVHVQTGASDVGMGSDTVMCAITAEVLGIDLEDVKIKRVDTAYSYPDPGSYGSRVTIFAGDATKKAAEDCKRQLLEVAARELNVTVDDVEIKDKRAYFTADETVQIPWLNLVRKACYTNVGNVVIGRGVSKRGVSVLKDKLFETGEGHVSPGFGFVAQANEIEVDLETGVMKCLEHSSMAGDCGFPLNPQAVETQGIGGSYHQGISGAIYEEFVMDNGLTVNPNFVDYKRPRAYEAPDPKFHHAITNDPFGPFGVKEASEASTCSGAPAVISALNDATGIWIQEIPATPEKVWRALKEKKAQEKK